MYAQTYERRLVSASNVRKDYMMRADSKSDMLLLSGPSRPLDFLICAMCSRAFFSVEGMSIVENSGFELDCNGS